MTEHANGTTISAVDAARLYISRGWQPIPIPPRQKNPNRDGWQKERVSLTDLPRFLGQPNIGVLLGEPSGGLVDIDLDHPEAVRLAPEFLPPTPAVFGREGKPRSHYIYRVIGKAKTLRRKTRGGDTIIELRSTGGQTVFPPSIHPSGQRIAWDDPEAVPAEVQADALRTAVERIADAALKVIGEQPTAGGGGSSTTQASNPASDRTTALEALRHLRPGRADAFDDWLAVGMALHSVDSSLLGEWEAWSRQSSKFQSGECAERWETFHAGGAVKIGTLIHFAKEDGWVRMPDSRRDPNNPEIVNADVIRSKEGTVVLPLAMGEILDSINRHTGNWPRRVGASLFVHEGPAVSWLNSPPAVFGYVGNRVGKPAKFHKNVGCHTKEETFHELRRSALAYRAVELLPHEPAIDGHYYACETPEPGDGETLRELIRRFSPATPIDADLLTAMFVTPLWGAAGGTRPAFLIDSPDGRGAGKSTCAGMVALLMGGAIDLSANEDAAVIKQRLLSDDGRTKRVALLDNVKTMRFSWAELESLITSPTISGKALYIGEAERPNNLTWLITLNGASLSTDMAQRCVIIRLSKPAERPATWGEETRSYIVQNRSRLIADAIAFLRSDRQELAHYSRWGAWERDVLSRLPEPAEAQAVIAERQQVADVEIEEADTIEDYFRDQLERLDYVTDREQIFIPNVTAARWLGAATNEKVNVIAAGRILKQRIEEKKMQFLSVCPNRNYGRGFLWTGENSEPVQYGTRRDIVGRLRDKGF